MILPVQTFLYSIHLYTCIIQVHEYRLIIVEILAPYNSGFETIINVIADKILNSNIKYYILLAMISYL